MKCQGNLYLAKTCHKYRCANDGNAALMSKEIKAADVSMCATACNPSASNSMTLSVIDLPATKPLCISNVTMGKYVLSWLLNVDENVLESVFESVSGRVWSAVRVVVVGVSCGFEPFGKSIVKVCWDSRRSGLHI